MVRRPLAADTDILVRLATGLDCLAEQLHHRRIALIEGTGHEPGVAIETQGQLGQVVGTDREAVEVLEKLIGQDHVGGYFAHHDNAKIVDAALETVLCKQFVHRARLVQRAHERNHDLDIAQLHVVAHALDRLAFEDETRFEIVADIA